MRDKSIVKALVLPRLYIAAATTAIILLFFFFSFWSKVAGKQQLIRLRFLSNHVSHLAVLLNTPENPQHEICFHIRFVHLSFYSLSSSTNCYANWESLTCCVLAPARDHITLRQTESFPLVTLCTDCKERSQFCTKPQECDLIFLTSALGSSVLWGSSARKPPASLVRLTNSSSSCSCRQSEQTRDVL